MIRGIDIPPEEFAQFARMFKERQNCAVPEITVDTKNNEEDSPVEN